MASGMFVRPTPQSPGARVGRAILLIALAALTLSACGGGSGSEAGSAGGAGSSPAAGSSAAGEAESAQSREIADEPGGFDRKIVKTAELGLHANDVRGSAGRAQEVAADNGGSVLSSRTSQGEGRTSATLVLSIPSPEFEAALGELRRVGDEVTTDSVEGEDVSEEYVDLESRERNLQAAEENLLDLYDEAESVDDALEVERELTEIRGEIEQAQGRIGYLEERTSDSRITVSIRQSPGSEAVSAGWDPGGTVSRSWNASLAVLQTLANGAISVVVFAWWLTPALAAGAAGFVWWRNRPATPTGTGPPEAG